MKIERTSKLFAVLSHPELPEALERLAKLDDIHGNPFAMTTDAKIARLLKEEVLCFIEKTQNNLLHRTQARSPQLSFN